MQSDVRIDLIDKALVVRLPEAWPVISWAPFNGGSRRASTLVNKQIESVDPEKIDSLFRESARSLDVLPDEMVGLLTAADVGKYKVSMIELDGLWVLAAITLGLDNARTVGEAHEPDQRKRRSPGTINTLLLCNALPNEAGRLEALHMVAMAKTYALMQHGVKCKHSGQPATGTGTDCIVIAASGEKPVDYCGMHTPLGELIGRTVATAMNAHLSVE
ncbi:MAG: adenosylcobinamide amidohydrolase [Candidatus Nitrohelix vancouverensis]|uniref:Adenosylcobinamide amidohydrolase n=1 Tax=Candidatus Nitrohelix vancouverensis TaxID=2705534 RepID=A0A7T0C391_9BACT|nr:MAG: adenosylcobinamide amidohydrolase [Candidatus Nitrohelix vancouverensis]